MVRPCGAGMVLVMRLRAEKAVNKVTLTPIFMRRFENWRDGLMWPWPGKVTRSM